MKEYWIAIALGLGWLVGGFTKMLIDKFQNPGVKVSIQCKHGRFIPGVHRFGKKISLYSCDRCDLWVELRDFKGKIDW